MPGGRGEEHPRAADVSGRQAGALGKITALPLAAPKWEGRWWELARLRALFGEGARVLGYDAGPEADDPDYAFLAVDAAGVRRSVVLLRDGVLIALDLAEGEAEWRGPAGAVKLLERRGHGETLLLHAISGKPLVAQDTIALVGARTGGLTVMFHAERWSARSPVWFDADGGPRVKWLATGLAPGTWEIWREAYLDDPQGFVPRTAGAMYFEGRPGRYYLRKLY